MMKILFVCLGNICRSPAAEAIMNALVPDIEVDSCAVANWSVGMPPYHKIVEACARKGYSTLPHQKAREITPHDFAHYDLILAADRAVLAKVLSLSPKQYQPKIQLLTNYSKKFHDQDIPDPYHKEEKVFDLAVDIIEDACLGLRTHFKNYI